MRFSRLLRRQLVPHVLAAWVAAFSLSFVHSCIAFGHPVGGVASATSPAGDPCDDSGLDDCARFCNDNTPVKADDPTRDDPLPASGGFLVAAQVFPLPVIGDSLPGLRAPSRSVTAPSFTALQRSHRLAL